MELENQSKVLSKVKELMEVQGYSQPNLAGISFLSLNNYFAGRSQLTDKAAEKILSVFGLSVYEVLGEDLPILNKSIRGYLEYNGEIKRINSFKDAENFVKKYREEVIELPKRVKEDERTDARNKKTATKHQVKDWDIVLDRVDTYDCSQVDVWAFRKTDDEREDITLALGNMCPGFDFEIEGQHFYGSEQAYICGMFSNNDPKHIIIQQALINETNGYGSKKQIRQKNEVLKREDWESFNIEWMKYVVWNKVKSNKKFLELLLSVPKNAYIVENSTHQKGRTAAIWGAKNQALEEARDRAVKYLSLTSQGRVRKEEENRTRNSLNYLGVYEGKNLMGKILKLCQLALLERKELDIDYELLRSKDIFLLGKKLEFK